MSTLLKKYALTILILLITDFASGQTNTIRGFVFNSETNAPIPFTNISISGSNYGTVSNSVGEFVLVLSSYHNDKIIKFSCIGFNTYELKPPHIVSPIKIQLSPLTNEIEEIVVMPDSTLRTLIRKACEKISENYPDFSTRSKGFYRTAMKETNGNYLILTEAILEVFKTSYRNKITGQIKVDKSRNFIAPGIDSVNNVSFYGGHYIPHTADLVKRRHPIVQGSNLYKYKLTKYEKIDHRDLYVIHFEPSSEETEGMIGEMFIDKNTLAYVKFEYRNNEEQLKLREKEPFANLSSKEINNVVIYAPTNEKYFLNAVSYNEKFENFKTGRILEHFSEYTLVHTKVGKAKPIPYKEISDYTAVISNDAIPYHSSDFRDYPVAQIEEHLLMSKNVSDSIYNNSQSTANGKSEENEKIKRIKKVLSVIERFGFEYNIQHQTLNIKNGNYALFHAELRELLNNDFNSSNTIWQYETQISYNLSKQMVISYAASGNLNKSYYSEAHKIYPTFILPLKAYGKQFFMTIQPGYKFQNTMLSLGESNKQFHFENSELTLYEGNSEVFWGERSHGFDCRVSFRQQISRHFWLNTYAGYYYPFNAKPVLRFAERNGNFFTKKNENIDLNESGLHLHINYFPEPHPKFDLTPFYWGFGIAMTL